MVGVKPRSRRLWQYQASTSATAGRRWKETRALPVRLVEHEHLELLGAANPDSVLIALLLRPNTAAAEEELLQPSRRANEDVRAGLVERGDIGLEGLPADEEERRRERGGGGGGLGGDEVGED